MVLYSVVWHSLRYVYPNVIRAASRGCHVTVSTVQRTFKALPDDVEGWALGTKGTAQKKIFRDCFTTIDSEAAPVIAKQQKLELLDRVALFPERFNSFSQETDQEIFGLGPKELAAKLAKEIGLNPDRRKLRKPGTNRAGGLAAAAKLTAEERIAKARKAALARYAKAKGRHRWCICPNVTHQ
jgi:hypothetical protein